jgi:hypothetical protein
MLAVASLLGTSCLGSGEDVSSGRPCGSDSVCDSGEVCARNGACFLTSMVRPIHVSWTLDEMPASAQTCSGSPDLTIDFAGTASGEFSDHLRFAPVPCEAGRYSIDKLPTTFRSVSLDGRGVIGDSGSFDDTGEAVLDLRRRASF